MSSAHLPPANALPAVPHRAPGCASQRFARAGERGTRAVRRSRQRGQLAKPRRCPTGSDCTKGTGREQTVGLGADSLLPHTPAPSVAQGCPKNPDGPTA